ncbi:DUF624 domain-containing protein [Bifidobacterium adolescentis]|uniref:DUF624 domain-containing protein n=1 Tax=Bifidobacterium adolescentis TaxID=1680 RepID=UPI0039821F75
MDTLLRFVGLNLVYLITLIPNVTIGPARAALYSTMFAYDEHDDVNLVREYLKRFKRSNRDLRPGCSSPSSPPPSSSACRSGRRGIPTPPTYR